MAPRGVGFETGCRPSRVPVAVRRLGVGKGEKNRGVAALWATRLSSAYPACPWSSLLIAVMAGCGTALPTTIRSIIYQ